jgi:DNA helicase-2/ATP-dependent DNA helicase PcrA
LAEDVHEVFRVPNRYLPNGLEHDVAQRLRAGESFKDAVSRLQIEDWRCQKLSEGAELLDHLSRERDAEVLVQTLRTEGGLDKHYSDQERMSSHDQIQIEAMEVVQKESQGKSPQSVADAIQGRTELLTNATTEDGIELSTMHGAKGREWSRVILFGWDDDQIPHHRVLEDIRKRVREGADPAMIEEAVEDERRLAYVGLTRTKDVIELVYTTQNPSRFLFEAGLAPKTEHSKVYRTGPTKEAVAAEAKDPYGRSSDGQC